ncbi:MAG: S9 family peptidase [Bacteroidales bacterium]|nr:S9 family peptidase [Bacteroidales bacterium]
MIKKLALIVLVANSVLGYSQTHIKDGLSTGMLDIDRPGFIMGENLDKEKYSDKHLIQDIQFDFNKIEAAEGAQINWTNNSSASWQHLQADTSGFVQISKREIADGMALFTTYIDAFAVQQIKLEIESPQMFEVYINQKKVISNYTLASSNETKTVNGEFLLDRGKSQMIIKTLSPEADSNIWKIRAKIVDAPIPAPVFEINPKERINIHHVLEGTKLKSAEISSDGNYVMHQYSEIDTKSNKANSWVEIKETATGKLIQTFRKSHETGMHWMPKGHRLYYITKNENGSSIWIFDLEEGLESNIAKNVADLSYINWSPNETYFIYSKSEGEIKNKNGALIYVDGLSNRYGYSRKNSHLFKYDLHSGLISRLTYGKYGTWLNDISHDGRFILISQSQPTPSLRPFHKNSLFLMDMNTGNVDTLWKEELFSGSAEFSPDGRQLLVTGGPDIFEGIGRNIGTNKYANNYDSQLFIYNIKEKKVTPITKEFNPNILSSYWHPIDNRIYVNTQDEIYQRLYIYDLKKKKFESFELQTDHINQISFSKEKLKAVVTANSQDIPNQSWLLDFKSKSAKTLDQTESESFSKVELGLNENWNFTKEDGSEIKGYIVYPPDFDNTKQYPLIVYYYGGTSPVGKGFGGRYPFNVWAANGYVIYCPQPSGATGFGQEFSARHQNDWGKTTADEIIEGTKKFIKAHDFVDADKIGCCGASYGGFMTMYLQTQTDIFACAIAHAGISSISSYWGEGDYGAGYSANASAESYPWNNQELYIKQSPLFHADKINTPILLLHGVEDENVPLGESMQMYVSLKILGKPVEMIKIEEERHHIKRYDRRIQWHYAMMSWFDKWLKGHDDHWKEMFPNSEL